MTPGRGLIAASAAARAPQTPGSAIRAQKDSIVAQLSAVFTRLSAHMQASSKDSSEKVGGTDGGLGWSMA